VTHTYIYIYIRYYDSEGNIQVDETVLELDPLDYLEVTFSSTGCEYRRAELMSDLDDFGNLNTKNIFATADLSGCSGMLSARIDYHKTNLAVKDCTSVSEDGDMRHIFDTFTVDVAYLMVLLDTSTSQGLYYESSNETITITGDGFLDENLTRYTVALQGDSSCTNQVVVPVLERPSSTKLVVRSNVSNCDLGTEIHGTVYYNDTMYLDIITNTASVGTIGLVALFDTETTRSLPPVLTSHGSIFNVTLQGTGFFDDDNLGEGTYEVCFSAEGCECNCNETMAILSNCVLPIISTGVSSWGGDAQCESGATVTPGVTCTIVSDSGWVCISPGVCDGHSGTFQNNASCIESPCTLPPGPMEGLASLDGCVLGNNVLHGVTCNAVAVTGYTCISPGQCNYGVFDGGTLSCTPNDCTLPNAGDLPSTAYTNFVDASCNPGDQVSHGTNCTIVSVNPGWNCTSPGMCTAGSFAQTGICEELFCTLPIFGRYNGNEVVQDWGHMAWIRTEPESSFCDNINDEGRSDVPHGTYCVPVMRLCVGCPAPEYCYNGEWISYDGNSTVYNTLDLSQEVDYESICPGDACCVVPREGRRRDDISDWDGEWADGDTNLEACDGKWDNGEYVAPYSVCTVTCYNEDYTPTPTPLGMCRPDGTWAYPPYNDDPDCICVDKDNDCAQCNNLHPGCSRRRNLRKFTDLVATATPDNKNNMNAMSPRNKRIPFFKREGFVERGILMDPPVSNMNRKQEESIVPIIIDNTFSRVNNKDAVVSNYNKHIEYELLHTASRRRNLASSSEQCQGRSNLQAARRSNNELIVSTLNLTTCTGTLTAHLNYITTSLYSKLAPNNVQVITSNKVAKIVLLTDTLDNQSLLQTSATNITINGFGFASDNLEEYEFELHCKSSVDAITSEDVIPSIVPHSIVSSERILLSTDLMSCSKYVYAKMRFNTIYLSYETELVGLGTIVGVRDTTTTQGFVATQQQIAIDVQGMVLSNNNTWQMDIEGEGCTSLPDTITLESSHVTNLTGVVVLSADLTLCTSYISVTLYFNSVRVQFQGSETFRVGTMVSVKAYDVAPQALYADGVFNFTLYGVGFAIENPDAYVVTLSGTCIMSCFPYSLSLFSWIFLPILSHSSLFLFSLFIYIYISFAHIPQLITHS